MTEETKQTIGVLTLLALLIFITIFLLFRNEIDRQVSKSAQNPVQVQPVFTEHEQDGKAEHFSHHPVTCYDLPKCLAINKGYYGR